MQAMTTCRRQHFGLQCIGLLGILSLLATVMAFELPAANAQSASDWTTYQYSNARSGFNKLERVITPGTVGSLKPRWTATAGGSISTQPVQTNGLVYWGSWDGYEHATSVVNGVDNWKAFVGQTTSTNPSCNPPTVGAASTATVAIRGKATPTVFVGGGDASFYALDAATGNILWRNTSLGASSAGNFVWSSPAVYNGSVYIGMASFGDCPLVQGKLFQLNASDGTVQHVFKVVPDGCIGGTVWGSPAIDSSGRLYFGTGNPGTCATSERYAEAVVQLNASDLSFADSWQVPAAQTVGDGDFGSTPTIFNNMLGIANKNGAYYAFARNHIGAGPVWQARVANGGGCPCDGSISPSAWDGTNLYVAGGSTTVNGVACAGSVRALNPSTGAFVWENCLTTGAVFGSVVAVPGLAVVGTGSTIAAVSTTSGQQLFSFQDPTGNSFWGGASVANGVLYAGNMDGTLYALSPNGR